MKSILFILFITTNLYAHTHRGAISHAPIGVMGDHTHKKGEFMMGARFMMMQKEGMRSGTTDLSDSDYSETMKPQEMNMKMAMLGFMYGVTDRLTIVPGVNYLWKEAQMKNGMTGMGMENKANGIGDFKLTFLYDLNPKSSDSVMVGKFSLSLPTGDTEIKNSQGIRAPYGIQLGSGTYDPTIGLTYKKYINHFELGSQLQYTNRLGENDEGYTLGEKYLASIWGAYAFSNMISSSVRFEGIYQDNIDGRDRNITMMPSMNPMVSTRNYGGTNVNMYLGMNFMLDGTKSTDNRLAFEYAFPLIQNLHGKQLQLDQKLILGWQKMF